jgi:hypothetical protein
MKFSVEVNGDPEGARVEGELMFHIFSESYWEPLVIVSNNSLLVEESTSIAITQFDLQVNYTILTYLLYTLYVEPGVS